MSRETVAVAAAGFTLQHLTCCQVTRTSRALRITFPRRPVWRTLSALLRRMGRWCTEALRDSQTTRERRKWTFTLLTRLTTSFPTMHRSRSISYTVRAKQRRTTDLRRPEDLLSLETFQIATKLPWIRTHRDPSTVEVPACDSKRAIRRRITRETVLRSTDSPACSRTSLSFKVVSHISLSLLFVWRLTMLCRSDIYIYVYFQISNLLFIPIQCVRGVAHSSRWKACLLDC